MREAMNNKGYTLIELVVVMAVFLIVIMISSYAFQNIVKRAGQQGRAAETGVAGMVGLEMMRTDIGHAGYGLPWSFQATPPAYKEIDDGNLPASGLIDTTTFDNFRDVPPSVPRAIVSGTGSVSSTTNAGIDYLVVKGVVVGMSPAAKRWNFVNYSGGNHSTFRSKGDSTTDLVNGDLVVTLSSKFSTTGDETRQLLVDSGNANNYYYTAAGVPNVGTANAAFQPTDSTQTVVAYGINTGAIRMPYNRADFYVDKGAAKPKSCASGTGVLYKAVANHAGGFTQYPLLDCVGDMQVVYDRDINGDGNLTPIDESTITTLTADLIRSQIKDVHVYILTHEGKQDPNFSYPPLDATNAVCVAPYSGSTCISSVGRMWTQAAMASTFGANWKNYRWKVYSFTVTLKNLQ